MSAIQVKRVPPDLHDAIRRRAQEEGLTVSDYILSVLRRDLATPTLRAWLARLEEDEPVSISSAADVVNAERAARDAGH